MHVEIVDTYEPVLIQYIRALYILICSNYKQSNLYKTIHIMEFTII